MVGSRTGMLAAVARAAGNNRSGREAKAAEALIPRRTFKGVLSRLKVDCKYVTHGATGAAQTRARLGVRMSARDAWPLTASAHRCRARPKVLASDRPMLMGSAFVGTGVTWPLRWPMRVCSLILPLTRWALATTLRSWMKTSLHSSIMLLTKMMKIW